MATGEPGSMTPGDVLQVLLQHARINQSIIGTDELFAVWTLLSSSDSGDFAEFEAAVIAACPVEWPASADIPPEDLGLRLGQWRLDLGKAAASSSLTAVVVAAIVALAFPDSPVDAVGLGLLTSLVPSVLQVERVRLSTKDQLLLADLRLAPHVEDRFFDVDELYARLPDGARARINRYDFADIVDHLRQVGATESGPNDKVRLRKRS